MSVIDARNRRISQTPLSRAVGGADTSFDDKALLKPRVSKKKCGDYSKIICIVVEF